MSNVKVISLNVKNDLSRGYKIYVSILTPLLKNIRPKNVEVLAQILYYNYLKKDLPYEDRFELIMSTSYRNKIKKDLNITDATLQNCLSDLRKKKIIINNKIDKQYLIYPNEKGVINLNFKINIQ